MISSRKLLWKLLRDQCRMGDRSQRVDGAGPVTVDAVVVELKWRYWILVLSC
ncbi:hypothetical protein I551_5678 [Mycobacterium ulcerans str. Harvey]|uniref:Uncharacterized protein n=1 Tax=Mycobacterium ulcerans str. Harvey TaxID=1299332 RepID=A0ABP3A9A0_MYCUL|nr:hypothetical protein I551_5678 [Mycobacterium ulcerans str. Harvey]